MEKLKNIFNRKIPDCLYHYTNGNSFLGIIKNKEMWASHIRFMNDLEERILAEKRLYEQLPEILKNEKKIDLCKLQENIKELIHESKVAIFVISLSEKGDELNMWRAYANKTSSYCIGISPTDFISHFTYGTDNKVLKEVIKFSDILNTDDINENIFSIYDYSDRKRKLYLLPCIYEEIEQKELINEIIIDSVKELEQEKSEITETKLSKEIVKRFMFYAPIIKSEHFKTEAEWRICIIYEKSFDSNFSADTLKKKTNDTEDEYEQEYSNSQLEEFEDKFNENNKLIDYRMGSSFIIPYYKFDFNPLCIKEITIGSCPDKESIEESTKFFLQQIGLSNLSANVKHSQIPYRSW